MRPSRMLAVLLLGCSAAAGVMAQGRTPATIAAVDSSYLRPGVSGGMGVSYVDMTDVVDIANATPGNTQRLPQFKAAVEFFGAVSVPVSSAWDLKLEYAYMLGSYNVSTTFGNGVAEYTTTLHMPSLILQYQVLGQRTYNVKVGAGGGYHFGTLEKKFFGVDDQYNGKGPGFVADVEANTAFSEDFFAYLGVNARWDAIGDITNSSGRTPGVSSSGSAPTMEFFGVGARLGFTYYF